MDRRPLKRVRFRVIEDETGIVGLAVFAGDKVQTIRTNGYRLMEYLDSDEGENQIRPPERGRPGSLVKDWKDIENLVQDLHSMVYMLTCTADVDGPIKVYLAEGSDETTEYTIDDLDKLFWEIGDARRFLWKRRYFEAP